MDAHTRQTEGVRGAVDENKQQHVRKNSAVTAVAAHWAWNQITCTTYCKAPCELPRSLFGSLFGPSSCLGVCADLYALPATPTFLSHERFTTGLLPSRLYTTPKPWVSSNGFSLSVARSRGASNRLVMMTPSIRMVGWRREANPGKTRIGTRHVSCAPRLHISQ